MDSEEPDKVILTESWVNEGLLGDRMKDYEEDKYNTSTKEHPR